MKLTTKNIIKCGFFPDNLPTRVFGSQHIGKYIDADTSLVNKIQSDHSSRKIEHTSCN